MDEDVVAAIAVVLLTIGSLVVLYGLHVLAHARDTLAGHGQETVTDDATGTSTQPIRGRW